MYTPPRPRHQTQIPTSGNNFDIFINRLVELQGLSKLPNPEPARFSQKAYGIVRGFGICTNQGLVRSYNEDRVSILLNIHKTSGNYDDPWPTCSLFGVFDGHGGSKCVDFIRQNLHNYVSYFDLRILLIKIAKSKHFPWNPQEALKEGFEEVEKAFMKEALSDSSEPDKSGSCALVLLFVDDICYICNLGDCRAIVSQNLGASVFSLTRDHKPDDKQEHKRITEAGGQVYQ